MDSAPPDTSTDLAFDGKLRLTQPLRGHRFGHDALILAASVPAKAGERAVDLGAGIGTAGLALAHRVALSDLALVEIDPALAALAARNAAQNALTARVLTLDITAPARMRDAAGLLANSFDHVLMNPPFDDPAQTRASPDPAKARAHQGGAELLAAWSKTAAALLTGKGRLSLIHRADALPAVLAALAPRFGGLSVTPVHARADSPALRVLVSGLKGSRAPFTLHPPLVLTDADGTQSPMARQILREGRALSSSL